MKALEELMFNISLLDSVSAPLRNIDRSIGNLKDDALKSFKQIGAGAAGMFASAYALNASIDPARNVKRSLGELASLDVSNASLDQMLNKSLDYSVQFGANSRDFIASAYDIQSSIDGINGTQLSNLTATSNILAKATKADAATITDYMGTMYGIFRDPAKEMGVDKWADMMSGMTAQTVKMFKSTGPKVSSYFSNLGADATKLGMTLHEQLAVGGMLGATKTGSESATQLKAFLGGLGKAEKELGLGFTTDTGKMLPIVEILDKITGKFGDLSKVADSDLIKKAFGTKEAASFIKLIGQDTDLLTNSIEVIGRTTGLEKVTAMAMKMVDPIDRTTSGMTALRIAFGKPLSDFLDPYFNKLADGMQQILKWSGDYKHLTKAISLTGGAVIGLIGVMSTLLLITGLSKLAFIGVRAAMLIFLPIVWATNIAMGALRATFLLGMFIKASASVGILSKAMAGLRSVILLVNLAMIANPIGLLIAAVVSITALVGTLIYKWDDLRKSFADNKFIMAIMDDVEKFTNGLKKLLELIGIKKKVGVTLAIAEEGPVGDALRSVRTKPAMPYDMIQAAEKYRLKNGLPPVPNEFKQQSGGLSKIKSITPKIDTNDQVLNSIRSLNLNPPLPKTVPDNLVQMSDYKNKTTPKKQNIDGLKVQSTVPKGGVSTIINKNTNNQASTTNSNSGMSIGEVHLHSTESIDGHTFEEHLRHAIG